MAEKKFWPAILVMVFFIILLINGTSNIPGRQYQILSENPFITRTDFIRNYWQRDILLPLFAHITHLTSRVPFAILCLAIMVGAFALFTKLALKSSGTVPAIAFSTILITSPLTTVLLSWVGTPDGLTFLLTIPFLFTNSILLIFILAILGAMNHLAFVFAATEILLLRMIKKDGIKIVHLFTLLFGLILGFLAVQLFLSIYHIQVFSRFTFILKEGWDSWIETNLMNFPMTIFSLFNIQWAIIPICMILFFKKDQKYYLLVLSLLILNYAITFFSLDTTRIFSLLSWGILAHCLIHSFAIASSQSDTCKKEFLLMVIAVGVLSFLSPRYYSFEGKIIPAPFFTSLERYLYILSHLWNQLKEFIFR
jgi:hypothetical protein